MHDSDASAASGPEADEAPPGPEVPVLRLRRHEDRRLSAGHLWVFSNEVDTAATPLTAFTRGQIVQVQSDRGRFLGYAYVNPHSLIAARILSRSARFAPGRSLLVHRLRVALALRERLYATPHYRLVYGESDGLPGLVIDRYGAVCVVQIGTAGMEAQKDDIVAALEKVVKPAGVLFKNDSGARELEGLDKYVSVASGTVPEELEVVEGGLRFAASLREGQKTGWFFDQAGNRQAVLKYVRGARVLDVCSYVGAWGVQAAAHGASEVVCVDSSAPALAYARRNAVANGATVQTLEGDAFDVLEQLQTAQERFDVVIVDPPAFIKRRKDLPQGQAAYRRLNQRAMQLLTRDGILVSCSCSQHLESGMLLDALQKASRHLGRFAQVIETGGQGPDHPVHPAIPETRYLKAFTLRVVTE
jgi:23S rRNA (cytosine1962-C5)-methyltransferase